MKIVFWGTPKYASDNLLSLIKANHEIIAVITAILYLLLAAREVVRCWYAAIISSILYFYIMYKAGLFMEAYLQIFYIISI